MLNTSDQNIEGLEAFGDQLAEATCAVEANTDPKTKKIVDLEQGDHFVWQNQSWRITLKSPHHLIAIGVRKDAYRTFVHPSQINHTSHFHSWDAEVVVGVTSQVHEIELGSDFFWKDDRYTLTDKNDHVITAQCDLGPRGMMMQKFLNPDDSNDNMYPTWDYEIVPADERAPRKADGE